MEAHKMRDGLVKTVLKIGTGFAIGMFAAGSCNENTPVNSDYMIMQKNNKVEIYSNELDISHELKKIGGDFYMGNSDHNYKGAKQLMMYETQEAMKNDR